MFNLEKLTFGKLKPNRQFRSIPWRTILYMAWRNLSNKKLRTGLTITGMIIGVGAIYFLVSLGLGLRGIVTKEVLGNQSVQVIDVLTPNSKILKLDKDIAKRVKNLPHVQVESVSFSFPAALKLESSEIDGIVYGIDSSYQALTSLNVSAGRLLSAKDEKVAVVNRATLRSMGIGNDKAAIGKVVELDIPLKNSGAEAEEVSGAFKIIGVIDSDAGSEVFIPKEPFEIAGVPNYSQVRILAEARGYVPELRRQIESLGFQTSSPLDTIDQINQIFRYFNLMLVGLGAIGMLVAILGMFNTLTVALLERTKEIGLMVALGGRNKDMRRLFVYEAMLLSVIGAVVGIVMASAAGSLINAFMNLLAHRRGVVQSFELFYSPMWLVVATILFMVCIWLAVVYYPARRAEHINPIDALRRE